MNSAEENEILSQLSPCPFCGKGEFGLYFNRLNKAPTMSGKESPVVSIELRHWCDPFLPNQPKRGGISFVGRDSDSLIKIWNRRLDFSCDPKTTLI